MTSFTSIADVIGRALLHSVWEGAALALLFAAAMVFLRNRSAQSQYIAGCVTLALMVAAPIATAVLRPNAGPAQSATVFSAATRMFPVTKSQATDMPPASQSPAVEHTTPSILQSTTLVWSIGLFVVSLWQIRGWFVVRNLVRQSLPAAVDRVEQLQRLCDRVHIRFPVAMRMCDQLTTPALVGWLRPVILIPAAALCDLPVDYFESLLLHELAHVRRHDYLINLLQTVIETLLFYHPAAWWLSRVIRQEREYCCDDQAVRYASPKTYVRALASMETVRASASPRLTLGANSGNLLRRIRRLTSAPQRSRSAMPVMALAVLAVGIAALLPSRLLQHAAAKPQTPQTLPASFQPAGDQGWVYRLAPTDRIELTFRFAGRSDVVQTASVDVHGDISLELGPDPSARNGSTIHAAGLTPKELEREIANSLATHAMSVRVIAFDVDNSFYVVNGHVKRPGSFQMMYDRPTIRDAITNAGGITELPGKYITVVRTWPAGTEKRRINLDAAKVLANDSLSNIEVRPRDVIAVGTRGATPADGPSATRPAMERASTTPVLPSDIVQLQLNLEGNGAIGPRFIRTVTYVSKSGELPLELIKAPIHVNGLTELELKNAVNAAYHDAGYGTAPVESVNVGKRGLQPTGSYFSASAFTAKNKNIHLLEAIDALGGLEALNVREVLITRWTQIGVEKIPSALRRNIPIEKLLAGDAESNVLLDSRDQVTLVPWVSNDRPTPESPGTPVIPITP